MSDSDISNNELLERILNGNSALALQIQAVEVRLSLKIEEVNHKINNLSQENTELKEKLETIERHQRKNNIIIFGLDREEEQLNINSFLNKLNNYLTTDIKQPDLNNIYLLGKGRHCPIKLEFISYLNKQAIFRNIKNLKGTKISIVDDLTYFQREENKLLKTHLHEARKDNQNTCFIKRGQLYLNGKYYKPTELNEISPAFEKNIPNSDPGTPLINSQPTEQFNKINQGTLYLQESLSTEEVSVLENPKKNSEKNENKLSTPKTSVIKKSTKLKADQQINQQPQYIMNTRKKSKS